MILAHVNTASVRRQCSVIHYTVIIWTEEIRFSLRLVVHDVSSSQVCESPIVPCTRGAEDVFRKAFKVFHWFWEGWKIQISLLLLSSSSLSFIIIITTIIIIIIIITIIIIIITIIITIIIIIIIIIIIVTIIINLNTKRDPFVDTNSDMLNLALKLSKMEWYIDYNV